MKIFVLISCFLWSSGTKPSSDLYIRTQVNPDVFPYVALIPHTNLAGIDTACTATILNAYWVLTTGLCVLNMERDLYRKTLTVYAYATSSSQPWEGFKQKRPATYGIRHPKHVQGTVLYNQGVLKVRKGFVFDLVFARVRFYSVDMTTVLNKMHEIQHEFQRRRCEDCKQPDFGKYDCRMVSWKMKNYTEPHLRLMEVTLFSYQECDKINEEFNVTNPPQSYASVCAQPKRLDKISTKGPEQVTPPEFYESSDHGAPLICSEAGTERYFIWGTFSQTMLSTKEGTKGEVAYAHFTTIESVLYGYHFDDPYGRVN